MQNVKELTLQEVQQIKGGGKIKLPDRQKGCINGIAGGMLAGGIGGLGGIALGGIGGAVAGGCFN